MKKVSFYIIFALVTVQTPLARATTLPHTYAGAISARNIGAIQHSIMTGAINNFGGTTFLSPRPVLYNKSAPGPDVSEYGHKKVYGDMLIYGEYNDDGTATRGHSGGDTISKTNTVWATWQHTDDTVKFNNFESQDTNYDIIMLGADGKWVFDNTGDIKFGIYGGYVGARPTVASQDIHQNGGYIGLYGGGKYGALNIDGAIDAGLVHNKTQDPSGIDKYTDAWLGATAHTSYNMMITPTFVILPELYAGLTMVKSENYVTNATNAHIKNGTLFLWELAPGLRAVKNIMNNWFVDAHGHYVALWQTGAKMTIDNISVTQLDERNYFEYGLGIGHTINRFNLSATVNRRDGGRSGWNFGVNMKYEF